MDKPIDLAKAARDPEQLDRHSASRWRSHIASQPLCPREPIMCPLGTGKGRRRGGWSGRAPQLRLDRHALVARQLDTCPPMQPSIPVPPQERSSPHGERMQQHAHLARLGGGAAIPLTLLAKRTGTTTTDAGRIDHTQAPVGFSAPLMRNKRLASRTAQCAIRLEGKVLPREAALFPG